MEKIKGYLFELSLLAIMGRSFLTGPTISDALVIITMVGAILYTKEFLNKKKIDDKAEIREELRVLKNEIAALKLDRGIRSSTTPMKTQYFEANSEVRRF